MFQKSDYIGPRLPTGGALHWDMTQLTDEQLGHEHHLAYESLYGHTYEGVILIPGLLSPDFDKRNFSSEIIKEALATWTLRFQRAENELERRYLLS